MSEEAIRQSVAAATGISTPGETLDLRLSLKPMNDIGNAERLRERHGRDLIWVPEMGLLAWAGDRWSDEAGAEMGAILSQKTAKEIHSEAEAFQLAFSAGELKDQNGNRATELRKWGHESGFSPRLSAMLREARPHLLQAAESLNADPNRFNTANRTLVLGEEVRAKRHSRRDFITHISPVAYDPDADCPLWRALIAKIQPDPESQKLLQRWSGYGLTGDTSEQCMAILKGDGNNGKSTFVSTIAWVMGGYAGTMRVETLLRDERARGSEATPDLAALPGKRAVFAAEPPKDARLAEGRIKELTGGEPIQARQLNRPFFVFTPTFKLTLSCNSLPLVRGQDDGIWRRIRVIPFDVQIAADERDKHLAAKLRKEGSGILNWLLDGYREWREKGLGSAGRVAEATAEYRASSIDQVVDFIAAACIRDRSGHVLSRTLRAWYLGWCRLNGLEAVSSNRFGRALTELGFVREKMGVISYRGLTLKENLSWQPVADAEAA